MTKLTLKTLALRIAVIEYELRKNDIISPFSIGGKMQEALGELVSNRKIYRAVEKAAIKHEPKPNLEVKSKSIYSLGTSETKKFSRKELQRKLKVVFYTPIGVPSTAIVRLKDLNTYLYVLNTYDHIFEYSVYDIKEKLDMVGILRSSNKKVVPVRPAGALGTNFVKDKAA